MTIKTHKEHDGKWIVWNTESGATADIVAISEYSLLPTKQKYRVDVRGKTIASGIEHFQTAKSKATKAVR